MIITFCYSGAIELTIDNVENKLAGAKQLHVESLTLVCSGMLGDLLSKNEEKPEIDKSSYEFSITCRN